MTGKTKERLYKSMAAETGCYIIAYYSEGDSSKCCAATKLESNYNTTEFCEVYERSIYD